MYIQYKKFSAFSKQFNLKFKEKVLKTFMAA